MKLISLRYHIPATFTGTYTTESIICLGMYI